MSGPGGIGGNRPVNTGYTAPTQGAGQVKQPGMEFVQDLVLGGKVRTAQAQTPGKSFTETMGAAFTSMGASVTSFFKGLGDRMATIEMPSLPRISLRRQEAAQPEAAQPKAAEPPHKQANERLKETYSKPSSATFCELFTLRAAEAGGRVPLADVNLDGLGKAIAKKIETESKGGKNPVSEATAHAIAQTQIDKFIGTKNALLDVVAARNLPLAEATVVNRFALQAEIRNPQALNAALDLRGSISTLFGQLQDPTLSRGDLIGALCEYQRAYDAALQPLVMGKTAEEFGADDIVSFASDALELNLQLLPQSVADEAIAKLWASPEAAAGGVSGPALQPKDLFARMQTPEFRELRGALQTANFSGGEDVSRESLAKLRNLMDTLGHVTRITGEMAGASHEAIDQAMQVNSNLTNLDDLPQDVMQGLQSGGLADVRYSLEKQIGGVADPSARMMLSNALTTANETRDILRPNSAKMKPEEKQVFLEQLHAQGTALSETIQRLDGLPGSSALRAQLTGHLEGQLQRVSAKLQDPALAEVALAWDVRQLAHVDNRQVLSSALANLAGAAERTSAHPAGMKEPERGPFLGELRAQRALLTEMRAVVDGRTGDDGVRSRVSAALGRQIGEIDGKLKSPAFTGVLRQELETAATARLKAAPTLDLKLADPAIRESMRAFLTEGMCVENLDFRDAIRAFQAELTRDPQTNTPEQLVALAGRIDARFVGEGTPQQINVSAKLADKLEEQVLALQLAGPQKQQEMLSATGPGSFQRTIASAAAEVNSLILTNTGAKFATFSARHQADAEIRAGTTRNVSAAVTTALTEDARTPLGAKPTSRSFPDGAQDASARFEALAGKFSDLFMKDFLRNGISVDGRHIPAPASGDGPGALARLEELVDAFGGDADFAGRATRMLGQNIAGAIQSGLFADQFGEQQIMQFTADVPRHDAQTVALSIFSQPDGTHRATYAISQQSEKATEFRASVDLTINALSLDEDDPPTVRVKRLDFQFGAVAKERAPAASTGARPPTGLEQLRMARAEQRLDGESEPVNADDAFGVRAAPPSDPAAGPAGRTPVASVPVARGEDPLTRA